MSTIPAKKVPENAETVVGTDNYVHIIDTFWDAWCEQDVIDVDCFTETLDVDCPECVAAFEEEQD